MKFAHRARLAASLALGGLLMAGCDSSLLAGLKGGNSLNGGTGQASPSPTPTPTPSNQYSSTSVIKENVVLPLIQDPSFTTISLYKSNKFDFATGMDSSGTDHGQIEFMSWSGRSNSEDNGNFIYGRQYASKKVDLGFIDKGAVEFGSIKELPEYGWSAPPVGNRNSMKLTPGNVYLFRVQYPSDSTAYYGKLWLKDWSSEKVTFDYVFQTTTGSRSL